MTKLPQANKKLGQHFLNSSKVIEKICSDHEDMFDVIIEVGPGPGILTEHLAKLEKPFFIIEKDLRFEEKLKSIVNPERVFIQDALKFNWPEFIAQNNLSNKKIWLVSNLPYNVGTILYLNFLQINEVKFMTLMFQKEVGQKTFTREIKNQMNGLLFLSKNYFYTKQLIKVSPGCFTPPPKVDSVVVSYVRKEEPDIIVDDFKNLDSFLRLIFGMKRKQLNKILKSQYSTELISNAFKELNILPSIRAEALNHSELLNLYRYFTQN